jgi:hypothetical protein
MIDGLDSLFWLGEQKKNENICGKYYFILAKTNMQYAYFNETKIIDTGA